MRQSQSFGETHSCKSHHSRLFEGTFTINRTTIPGIVIKSNKFNNAHSPILLVVSLRNNYQMRYGALRYLLKLHVSIRSKIQYVPLKMQFYGVDITLCRR